MLGSRFIAFIFLFALLPLGCGILYQGENMLVRNLNAIILTAADLPTMKLDGSSTFRIRGLAKQPPVVYGFSQSWDRTQPEEYITVRYWLFRSVGGAKRAADKWRYYLGATAEFAFQPELNAKDVIGDATWRVKNEPDIWFVQNNVLVCIMGKKASGNQPPLTNAVARKIEARINAALN